MCCSMLTAHCPRLTKNVYVLLLFGAFGFYLHLRFYNWTKRKKKNNKPIKCVTFSRFYFIMRLSSRQWIVVERIHSSRQLIAFLELVYIILSNIKCQRVMNFSKLHFFGIKVLTLCHGFFMWFLATDAWLMFCYKILYFDFMWNQWSSRQFSFWIYTVFFSLSRISEWSERVSKHANASRFMPVAWCRKWYAFSVLRYHP